MRCWYQQGRQTSRRRRGINRTYQQSPRVRGRKCVWNTKIKGRVPAFCQASLPQRFIQVAQMCIGHPAGRAIRTERHHTGREALVSIH